MLSCFKGKFVLTSPMGEREVFGQRDDHKGIDLVGIDSPIVYSPFTGIARTLEEPNGFGKYVRIEMDNGLWFYAAHLNGFLIDDVSEVHAGDKIGIMGETGRVTGVHTHIELRVENTKNPLNLHKILGIPRKLGEYVGSPLYTYEDAKRLVRAKCGLEPHTINYLDGWEWNEDLFIKLAMNMVI